MSSYAGSASDSDEGLADRSFSSAFNMNSTTFADMVHDMVDLNFLCYRIINTPQFQRLRNLKQVGLCCFVFPTSTHTRFEHCIGTSYLAGEYAKILRKNQPELDITDKDILCVSIAGLVHDIGHGPFSHTWEQFMKVYKADYSHEIMSIRLLDHMIKENGLWDYFDYAGLEQIDLTFIKECILGHPLPGNDSFMGRSPEKFFLYQIVSNEDSKIDVDKFDYMLRDCKHLSIKASFEYKRVMGNSRVVAVPVIDKDGNRSKSMKIVYRKKIADSLEDLFQSRFRLHQKAYQHKLVKIIETMLVDGLHEANASGFTVKGQDGAVYKLSTAYKDLCAFGKLTDSIFEIIKDWSDVGIKAKQIFEKIQTRDLYKFFGYLESPPQEEALKELKNLHPNIKIIRTKINFGKGTENPLNYAYFYEKNNTDAVFTCAFPPPKVEEKCYIVFQPLDSESELTNSIGLNSVKTALQEWARFYKVEIHSE